jgi:PIN domain nuclease of toxin-antitoxin system
VTVLLDTHAAVWLATADLSLGKRSRALLAAAVTDGTLLISAISFWEISLLLEKGRLQSALPAESLRHRLLQTGIREVPLTGEIAVLSTRLSLHGDPADRFIAASCVAHGAALLTADERLLAWKHATKRHDARR